MRYSWVWGWDLAEWCGWNLAEWWMRSSRFCGWDLAEFVEWDLAEWCGWDLAERCGWDLAEFVDEIYPVMWVRFSRVMWNVACDLAEWWMRSSRVCGWDLAQWCGWDLAEWWCGWYLSESWMGSGRVIWMRSSRVMRMRTSRVCGVRSSRLMDGCDIAEWWLTANAKVATVLGSIPAFTNTKEIRGAARQSSVE